MDGCRCGWWRSVYVGKVLEGCGGCWGGCGGCGVCGWRWWWRGGLAGHPQPWPPRVSGTPGSFMVMRSFAQLPPTPSPPYVLIPILPCPPPLGRRSHAPKRGPGASNTQFSKRYFLFSLLQRLRLFSQCLYREACCGWSCRAGPRLFRLRPLQGHPQIHLFCRNTSTQRPRGRGYSD